MVWISIILFIVMIVTILTPASLVSPVIVNDGRAFLDSLDVCHTATPALSSTGDMPFMNVIPSSAAPAFIISVNEPFPQLFSELILASRNERPPRS
jgi:hypothetical protein